MHPFDRVAKGEEVAIREWGEILNLGCGDQEIPHFIGVDRIPGAATYIGDIITPIAFHHLRIKGIYCAHVLQCLPRRSFVSPALRHWYSWLEPGGIIVIEVPNLGMFLRDCVQRDLNWDQMNQGIYGHDREGLVQTCGFTESSLRDLIEGAGFDEVHPIPQLEISRHNVHTNITMEGTKL